MPVRPHTGSRSRAAVGLLAAVAVTALAGCGDDGKDAAPASSSPAATTPATTPPTPSASPSAADGTNLRACRDGSCEVEVKRPATIRTDEEKLDLSSIKVTSLADGEISFRMTLASGQFDFGCDADPECNTSVVGLGSGVAHVTAHPGAQIKANGVKIEVVTATKTSAILHLKPR